MFNTILAKATNTLTTIKEVIKKLTYKVIPISLACMMSLCAFGCSATDEQQAIQQITSTDTITVTDDTLNTIDLSQFEFENWAALDKYITEPELRQSLDSLFNTKTVKVKSETTNTIEDSKNGVLYVDYQTGNHLGNNTLYSVFMNSKFRNDYFNKSGSRYTELLKTSDDYFMDLEVNTGVDDDLVYGALSGYFNILDDNNSKEFNSSRVISRKEALANYYKATNQYNKEIIKDVDLANVEDEIDILASKEISNSLVSTAEHQDKAMTSGEFLYLLMNKYYSLDEVTVDDSIKVYKTSGNIYTDITEASSDLSKGTPEAIAKAITIASEKGIINPNSYDWSASLTKHEFFDLLTKVFMKQTPKIDRADGLFEDASAAQQDSDMHYDAEEIIEPEPTPTSESTPDPTSSDDTIYKKYVTDEQLDVVARFWGGMDYLNSWLRDCESEGATAAEIKEQVVYCYESQLELENGYVDEELERLGKELDEAHDALFKPQQSSSSQSTETPSTPPASGYSSVDDIPRRNTVVGQNGWVTDTGCTIY